MYRLNTMTRDYEGFFENSQQAKDRQAYESRYFMYGQCARKLFQTLNAALAGSEMVGFTAINERARDNIQGVKQLKKLYVILAKYCLNEKGYYLRVWHLKALGWVKANRQKIGLVEANDVSSLRRKFFALWRGVFHRNARWLGNKCDGIRRLQAALDKGDVL